MNKPKKNLNLMKNKLILIIKQYFQGSKPNSVNPNDIELMACYFEMMELIGKAGLLMEKEIKLRNEAEEDDEDDDYYYYYE